MAIPTRRTQKNRFDRAVDVFKKYGGILRTSEAISSGIHPDTLYSMRDSGRLEKISRGIYRLESELPLNNPDLVTVAKRIPNGVICLSSALSFFDITTQIPHEVHLALPQGSEEPRLDYPPIRTFRFSRRSFSAGIEKHRMDNVIIRIYSPEKTLADCFKFRNKIGIDIAIEALRLYQERRKMKIDDIMHFASICRVANIIRPYMEAII
ncbi:MAG: transcriptional regulator [Candidatus Aminicenantes bacterium]|jgi:predicted transcriptional regulator of viral defense system|nr:transcriptional regulator [Candidatus Aminicenantes bacterium]